MAVSYSFTIVSDPLSDGFGTYANGINDSGQIVGVTVPFGNFYGFIDKTGIFTTLPSPSGGAFTNSGVVSGINSTGQVVGSYENGRNGFSAFIYSDGVYTTLVNPFGADATFMSAQGINDLGQVVGFFGVSIGFIYSNGSYTLLQDPLANGDPAMGLSGPVTVAYGINNSGQVVGQYDSADGLHGFVYSNGAYTTLDDPLGVNTDLTGINNSGQIVGYYQDSNGVDRGFVFSDGVFTTIEGPFGAFGAGSQVAGINDSGQILLDDGVGTSYLGTPAELFTSGANTVNFNSLKPMQQSAIASGADLYNGLGGSDVVTLPSVANYDESLGKAGGTLNWNPSSTFSTGSLAGDTYSVRGSDGSYNIALGAGSDRVTINGNGSSTITAGSGSATVAISGTGDDTFNGILNGTASISGGGTLDITGNLTGSATIGPSSTLQLGGTASGLKIDATARLEIESGGDVSGTTVNKGGFLYVSSGGSASGTVINSGGFVYVESGGADIGAILSGGEEIDQNGGNDTSTTIDSGGTDIVQSGGTAVDTTVNGGGYLDVLSAGTIDLVINGGKDSATVELHSGDIVNGPIRFTGTNDLLKIDGVTNATTPITISGFASGDTIDFAKQSGLTLQADYYSQNNPNEVDVYNKSKLVATLVFSGGVSTTSLEPVDDSAGGTKIIVDKTSAQLSNPQFSGSVSGIHWDVIDANEGGLWLNPYNPTDTSGVTIGIGLDLGTGIKQSQFTSALSSWSAGNGIKIANDPNLQYLYGAIGKSSLFDALDYLKAPYGREQKITLPASINGTSKDATDPASVSVSITQSQAIALTNWAQENTVKAIQPLWNASSPLSSLPWQAQTVLVDVAYNSGPKVKYSAPIFWKAMVAAANSITSAAPDGTPAAWAQVVWDLDHFLKGGASNNRLIGDAQLIEQIPGVAATPPPTAELGNLIAANDTSYNFAGTAGTQYALDPSGATSYILTAQAGSSNLSSIVLPDSNADQYAVSYEIGSIWSTPEIAQPLQTLTLPANVVGLRVDLEDAKGNPIPDPGSFTFYVTFATAGTFAGDVLDMSVASGTTISAGMSDTVFTTAANLIVLSGGTLDVASGGTATGTRVSSGGTDTALAGGADNSAIVIGGTQLVYGAASDTIVSAGGIEIVESGGVATGTAILNGDVEIAAGGMVSDTTISGGGTEIVSAGGTTSDTTVFSSGTEMVSAGGSASDTTVSGGGILDVLSGGLADPATILSGGNEIVSAHGTDDGAQISGGKQLVFGVASGVTVFSGSQVVEAGGTASETTVSGAGAETVLSGGTAVGATSVAGGTVTVSSGGTFEFTSDTTGMPVVRAGATLEIGSGYVFSGTVNSGIKLEILSGGTDSGATVSSGGREIVLAGGTASNTTVLKGGIETVSSGGTASDTSVSSGGTVSVLSNGTFEFATVFGGGKVNDSKGGTAHDLTVSSGGSLNVAGTITSNVVVFAGGVETVSSGGLVSGTVNTGTAISGGTVNVLSGGAFDFATVYAGGKLNVSKGGTAFYIGVASGGALNVAGTITSDVTVFAGGVETVSSGGVVSGGINSGTLVSGVVNVLSGGKFEWGLLSAGGTLNVSAGGTADELYVAGGVLNVHGKITSDVTVYVGGVERVSSGGVVSGTSVADTTLSGGEVDVLSGGKLTFATVLSGGDLTVSKGGSAASIVVSSGGNLNVAGTTTSNVTVSSDGYETVSSGGVASGTTIAGGTVEITNGGSTGGKVTFAAGTNSGTLQFDSTTFSGTVAGMTAQDTIDLRNFSFGAANVTSSITATSATLTVSAGGDIAHIILLGNYMASTFTASNDGLGGTTIVDPHVSAAQTVSLAQGIGRL